MLMPRDALCKSFTGRCFGRCLLCPAAPQGAPDQALGPAVEKPDMACARVPTWAAWGWRHRWLPTSTEQRPLAAAACYPRCSIARREGA